jgi:hypothetical protein
MLLCETALDSDEQATLPSGADPTSHRRPTVND